MRLKKPKRNLKVAYQSTVSWVNDKQKYDALVDQASLDHILDKVAVSGYESLTLAEKQQLFNAGK
jgi:hypothetical protein